ncbi:MAG: NAD(P)-dependent oxidoreductase [Arenicella sp.]
MQTIGFIGLGIMGKPMAGHLLRAGYKMQVYNRTQSKADELVENGATRAMTPAEAAKGADVVITIVSDTPQVEEVLFGDDGVAETIQAGSIVVDMTTMNATAIREFANRLQQQDVALLDAPVSGGDIGAINATLSIMVGGEQMVYDRVKPLFDVMGSRSNLIGPIGSGQITKSCNQILVGTALMGVCEALLLAEKNGLNLHKVVDAVAGGAAQSFQLEKLGPLIVEEDYKPGFMIDLIVKDLHIVQDVAKASGLSLETTNLLTEYFENRQGKGDGALGTPALMKEHRIRAVN